MPASGCAQAIGPKKISPPRKPGANVQHICSAAGHSNDIRRGYESGATEVSLVRSCPVRLASLCCRQPPQLSVLKLGCFAMLFRMDSSPACCQR